MTETLITRSGLTISETDIEMSAVRSQGAGGQNVNKVASAIHLRFDIRASTLPEAVQNRMLNLRDSRINSHGVLIIKAQNHRTQERNRAEALERLKELVDKAAEKPRSRIPTRPGRAAKERRLQGKKRRGDVKKMRRNPLE